MARQMQAGFGFGLTDYFFLSNYSISRIPPQECGSCFSNYPITKLLIYQIHTTELLK